jgi:hypothetical protein
MPKVNYEARFHAALKEIASYMTPAQLRRESSGRYGLEHTEALEMAYENVVNTAKWALKGYRKPRTTPATSGEEVGTKQGPIPTSASEAQKS